METDVTDTELDRLWNRHLDGLELPAFVEAGMTRRGPELHIRLGHDIYHWVKHREARQGRFWQLAGAPSAVLPLRERIRVEVPASGTVRDPVTGEVSLHPDLEARCRFLFGKDYAWVRRQREMQTEAGTLRETFIEISCPDHQQSALDSLFADRKAS